MKIVSERKMKSKLLIHYLNLAEQGDLEAEKKVKEISHSIFQEDELEQTNDQIITVTFPSGKCKEYQNMKEVQYKFNFSSDQLFDYLETGNSDKYGRKYEFK
ncbi:hypothetical protein [Enterococcus sp. 5H]|uniref:hypothetical protein n=1 Tax=Enterococcus sp. 5H TaxID=1229490 RepID=UPI002302D23C|nr:hypothetical protein [Enterococcus sp. 5H]MDA9469934.1 hypothetical protein [Enterococcus sp. 5H]